MGSPRLDSLLRLPAMHEARIAGSPLANVLNAQPRFLLVPDGEPGAAGKRGWNIQPETRGARALLEGPDGERVAQLIKGSVETVDARQPSSVTSVSLAVDEAGFAANLLADRLLSDPRQRRELEQSDVDAGVEQLTNLLARNAGASDGAEGAHDSGRISVSRIVSDELLAHARDPEAAPPVSVNHGLYVLGHELEHTVAPLGAQVAGPLSWLEEGTAEVLALHPDMAAARAGATGAPKIDIAKHAPEWLRGYRAPHEAVSGLLALAGVDAARPGTAGATAALLQDGELADVPSHLAHAIATHHRRPAELADAIAGHIRRSDGSASTVDGVRALLA